MTYKEALQVSRRKRLVPDDKFERHIKKAKRNDHSSRKSIFKVQTQDGETRHKYLHSLCNEPRQELPATAE